MDNFLYCGDLQLAHIPSGLVPHLANAPLPALGRCALLIGGEVEGNEEEEVRGKDADSGEGGEFLAGAFSLDGEVWEVGAGEVVVGCVVDEAYFSSG